MQRETKEIVTKGGKKVFIKTFLTGREVTSVMKNRGDKSDIDVSQELMKIALVSIDGKEENAFETLLDLPVADYLDIAKEINELAGSNFTKAK